MTRNDLVELVLEAAIVCIALYAVVVATLVLLADYQ
jgi:hypothetical protein